MAKKKASRIIFKHGEKYYKFISFFVSKSDNSFYFHIYRSPEEKLAVPKVVQSDAKTITISSLDADEVTFDQNKITFHESGFVHTTDPNGSRFKDGKIGIPFRELKNDYLLLLCISPKNPLDMVRIDKIDNERDIIIQFDPRFGPILVHFWIKHKDCKKVPGELPGENILGGFIEICYDNKEFSILTTLTKLQTIENGQQRWPPFTLVLNFVSNNDKQNLLRIVGKSF